MRLSALFEGFALLMLAGGATGAITYANAQSSTVSLQQFDPQCGRPGYNCRPAFQNAFAALSRVGGGILQLPAGTFEVDFPEMPQNVRSGPLLDSKNLLLVPSNVIVQGTVAGNGTYESVIQWSNTSVPTFVFDNANHSGLKNLHLQFTGAMPTVFPYFDSHLQRSLGHKQLYNQAGPYELFSFVYALNSDYCVFDHLLFDSATHDNDHIFAVAINLKGKGVIENDGGGMSGLATGNTITNLQILDFDHGMVIAGQNNILVENIKANRRGSTMAIPPGHVIYFTNLIRYDGTPPSLATSYISSTNVTIRNVVEGPDTLSNVNSLGTLAIKYINGGIVDNVYSQHPEGLLQSVQQAQNVTFSNMTWSSDYPLCQNVPKNCLAAKIILRPSATATVPSKNLTFKNISLISTAEPILGIFFGADDYVVDGLSITTPPEFLQGQTSPNGIVQTQHSNHGTINHFTYTPLLTSYNPEGKYNSPISIAGKSSDVNASVTINWPRGVPMPKTGSAIITSAADNSDATQVINTIAQTFAFGRRQ